jgi:hypothetical protein
MKVRYVNPNSNLDIGLSRCYARLALAYARKTTVAREKGDLGEQTRFLERFAKMANTSGILGLLGKQRG